MNINQLINGLILISTWTMFSMENNTPNTEYKNNKPKYYVLHKARNVFLTKKYTNFCGCFVKNEKDPSTGGPGASTRNAYKYGQIDEEGL